VEVWGGYGDSFFVLSVLCFVLSVLCFIYLLVYFGFILRLLGGMEGWEGKKLTVMTGKGKIGL